MDLWRSVVEWGRWGGEYGHCDGKYCGKYCARCAGLGPTDEQVARTFEASKTTLAILANSLDHLVRYHVANNWQNTSGRVLQHLASDPEHYVRCAVAKNPNTPAAALAILAREREQGASVTWLRSEDAVSETAYADCLRADYQELCRLVSCHPNTSAETLTFLVDDHDAIVTGNVVIHPGVLPDVLNQLGGYWWGGVREAVARSVKTSSTVLAALARDPVFEVAKAAQRTLRIRVPR